MDITWPENFRPAGHSDAASSAAVLPQIWLCLAVLMFGCAHVCKISGFRREVDENCAILGYYAESSGNSLPTSRNVGMKLPLFAA
jgi:hypothetical protein